MANQYTANHNRPHWVYRFLAASGDVLYVGCTSNFRHRHGQHKRHQPWWKDVVDTITEEFPDYTSAAREETRLIGEFSPPYNKQGNKTRRNSSRWASRERWKNKPGRICPMCNEHELDRNPYCWECWPKYLKGWRADHPEAKGGI